MEEKSFRLRTLFILLLLGAWGSLSIFQLYRGVIANREKYLLESNQFAWKEALLPGKRGAILDKEGKIIVSSILEYELFLTHLPSSPKGRKILLAKLRTDFPSFRIFPSSGQLPYLLKGELTPGEIRLYSARYHFWREVRIQSTMKRKCRFPELQSLAGMTGSNDKKEMVGISGLEKEFDNLLSGRNGRCQVMQDRFGIWYPESLRILQKPRHGQDVRTAFRLEEKLSEKRGESL